MEPTTNSTFRPPEPVPPGLGHVYNTYVNPLSSLRSGDGRLVEANPKNVVPLSGYGYYQALSGEQCVQMSSPPANVAPFHLGRGNGAKILDSPPGSPRRRDRESEADADEPGPERKISKHANSRHSLPSLTQPASRGFFIYGEAFRESKCASSPPPAQSHMPADQPFTVTTRELEHLRTITTRTLVVLSSCSDGTFRVQFKDPPAPAQAADTGVPLRAPVERHAEEPARADGKATMAAEHSLPRVRRPRRPARPDPSHRALPLFDPVSSQVAKVFRGQLRKALAEGASDEALYNELLVPMAGSRHHLRRENLAFTPEFLVAVLLVLPTLDEAQRTTLGNAVGRLRMARPGKLSSSARFAIADALEHESVRSRVSLDALLTFLTGTEKTESRRWSESGDDRPLRSFTNGGYRCGIPQALAKLLAHELQNADSQNLAPVLATTRRLASALAPERFGRGATQLAITDAINATSAPAAAKQQVIQEFLLGYLPIGDSLEAVELSE